MNDQTHGILLHASGKAWDGSLHLMTGNFSQVSWLRQKGASVTVERDLAKQLRLGASILTTSGSFRSRRYGAAHVRFGVNEGSSILGEAAITQVTPLGQEGQLGDVLFVQGSHRLKRGFFALLTLEQARPDFSFPKQTLRAGPGLQYFPIQRLEFRTDFYGTRALDQGVALTTYTWLLQAHIWL